MKFHWDKKYLYWGITAFLVVAASICFYSLLFHGTSIKTGIFRMIGIIMPIIYGAILAYLLSPILNWAERRLLLPLCRKLHWGTEGKNKGRIRAAAVCITFFIALLLAYGFFSMVIPQLISSIQSIILQFPVYVNNLIEWISEILKDNPDIEQVVSGYLEKYSSEINSWMNLNIIPRMNDIVKQISVSVLGFLKALWNFIIGMIISVYLLASKEKFLAQGKKIIYAVWSRPHANQLLSDLRFIDKTFGGFISGKLLDSLIIGILCFFCTSLIGTPYPVLISIIIGVTNIIPFFGPFMGAIPSILLILMVNPIQALYFLIFVVILQQFDGNVLGPRILGNSTGITGFWVIFSITLFSGLFGVIGMIIGVPIFAVVYAYIRRKVNHNLRKHGLSTQTADYMSLEEIGEKNEMIPDTGVRKEESSREK